MAESRTSRIASMVDHGLNDPSFHDRMAVVGLSHRSNQANIDAFRVQTESIPLTRQERRIITAYEPYGYLTSNRIVALNAYKSVAPNAIHRSRVYFFRALDRIAGDIDSELYSDIFRQEPTYIHRVNGIGIYTKASPTELALAYQIHSRQDQYNASPRALTEVLFLSPQDNSEEKLLKAEINFRTVLNRLEKLIPAGSIKRVSTPTQMVYRWSEGK